MRFATTIQCSGQDVEVEVMADGTLVFHNYDIEADLAAEALGLDETDCLKYYVNYISSPIIAIAKYFPLTGKAWAAIFVTLLKEKTFLYTDMMQMIDELHVNSGHLTYLPLEMLNAIDLGVTKSLNRSRLEVIEEWKEVHNEIDTISYNEKYLEDAYEEGVSSLISATQSWIRAVQRLYLCWIGPDFKLLSDQKDYSIRKMILDNIIEVSWLVCFFKVKKSYPLQYQNQALFDEALEMQNTRIEEIIQTMVSVVHSMEG